LPYISPFHWTDEEVAGFYAQKDNEAKILVTSDSVSGLAVFHEFLESIHTGQLTSTDLPNIPSPALTPDEG
jgi:hypothetical protein